MEAVFCSDAVLVHHTLLGCGVLGHQLATNKKGSILKPDNNRKKTPCFSVFWGCCLVGWLLIQVLSRGDIYVPCFPHFAVDLNTQALLLGERHLN